MSTLVSVLMPVYNCERYLDAAITSIREQTFRDFQFVIVNDGSTDGSLTIAKRHASQDGRVIVIDQPNGGIVRALNAGLARCSGSFIARMDGDDLSHPDRLRLQVDAMVSNPDIGVLGTHVTRFDEGTGRDIDTMRLEIEHEKIVAKLSAGECGVVHASCMFRHDALVKVAGYRERYCYAEDLDLFLRLSRVTCFANLEQDLYRYRQHRHSVSRSRSYQQARAAFDAVIESRGARVMDRSLLAVFHRRLSWCAESEGQLVKSWSHAIQAVVADPLSTVGLRALCRAAARSVFPRRWLDAD